MIDKLEQGQVIKNYIVLCELLEVTPTKGKGREYHIREFERYCRYHTEGRKFIVDEVYPEPLPKIDNRVNNGGHIANTKYNDLMDKLLINLLIAYEGEIVSSFTEMVDLLDISTKEFKKLLKIGYERYAEENKMSKGLVMIYQQKLNNAIKLCLERSLERLHKQGIIEYEKKIYIRDRNFEEDFATAEQELGLKKIEEKVYEDLEMTPFMRINPRKNRQFKSEVCKLFDIMSYWNVYHFSLSNKNMDNVEEDRDELVRRFIKSVVHSVKNKKSKDEWGNVFQPYGFPKFDADIDQLTKLLWNLPDGYMTDTDTKEDMQNLFGNDRGSFGEPEIEEDNYIFDVDEYEEYCQSLDDVPF